MIHAALLVTSLAMGVPAALAQPIPVPPIPPASPPRADLAPVPDNSIRMPDTVTDAVRVRPDVFTAARPDSSFGFAPGSRYQSADEKRPLQTPGLRLIVPLP